MIKKILPLLLILAVIFTGIWFFSHGYIEVSVNSGGKDVTYTILDQKSGRSVIETTKENSIKKLVRRGTQEVTVKTSSGSYFTLVKAGGWIGTNSTVAKIKPANDRQFVGDNPSICMNMVGETLVSYACTDTFDKLKIHRPAAATTPTIVTKPASPMLGEIEGLITNPEGSLILLKSSIVEGNNGAHFIYTISPNGALSNETELTDLDSKNSYKIISSGNGFLVYDNAGSSKAFQYASMKAKPTTIDIKKPKTKNLKFAALIVSGNQVAAVYSDNPDRKIDNISDPEGLEAHSSEFEKQTGGNIDPKAEIVILGNNKPSGNYVLGAASAGIGFCGQNKLCTQKDGKLSVYGISDGKAKFLYKISDVNAVLYTNDNPLIVRSGGIVSLDTEKREGYESLGLEDLSTCGINTAPSGFLLCVTNDRGRRSVLYINQASTNTTNIDSKIANLAVLKSVKDLTTYRNFISITPEVGEAEVNPQTGYFEYNQAKINAAKTDINKKVDELGIDRSVYTITFTVN